jgi:hypothetical protein
VDLRVCLTFSFRPRCDTVGSDVTSPGSGRCAAIVGQVTRRTTTRRGGLLGEPGDRFEHLADPVGVVAEEPGGLAARLGFPDDLEAHPAMPGRAAAPRRALRMRSFRRPPGHASPPELPCLRRPLAPASWRPVPGHASARRRTPAPPPRPRRRGGSPYPVRVPPRPSGLPIASTMSPTASCATPYQQASPSRTEAPAAVRSNEFGRTPIAGVTATKPADGYVMARTHNPDRNAADHGLRS